MKNSIQNITEEQAKELVGKFNKYRIGNMKNQRLYTKQELLKAIEYACSSQKFSDYQKAGQFLISDNPDIEGLLNHLSNIDDNAHEEITIKDVEEYFLSCDPETDSFSNTIDRMNRQIKSIEINKSEQFKILENKYNYLLDVHQKLVKNLQKARIFAEKIIKRNNSKEHKEMEDLFAQMLEHIQKQKNKNK